MYLRGLEVDEEKGGGKYQEEQPRWDLSPRTDRHAINVCTEKSNIVKLQYGQSG